MNKLNILLIGLLMVACTRHTTPQTVAVEACKLPVVYFGLENPFTIAASGTLKDSLTVTATNAEITGSQGHYLLTPLRPGLPVKLTVKAGNTILRETDYTVEMLPMPRATFTTPILKGDKYELAVSIPNCIYDIDFPIQSFTMLTGADSLHAQSHKFTEAQIAHYKQLPKRARVDFVDIVVLGPDGKKRQLASFFLRKK